MTDEQVTAIMKKETVDDRTNTEPMLGISTGDGREEDKAPATAVVSVYNRYGIEQPFEYIEHEDEPREDGGGLATARIPNGTTAWPLETGS